MAKRTNPVDGRPKVVMTSEEFGEEQFIYLTIDDARDGFLRLKRNCARSFKKDRIDRRLLLVIADWQAVAKNKTN
jgi:hypothetical protein